MILLMILEIFTIIVQKMVCDKLFIKKYSGGIRETAVWASFFVLFNMLTYVDFISVYLNALVFFLLFFLVLQLLYKDGLKKKLIFTIFMYLVGMGSEFLVYQGANAVGIIIKETMVSGKSRLYCTIISKLIWYTAIRVTLLMWRRHWKTDVKIVDWLAALLVPVSSIFIAAAIIDLNPKSGEWLKFLAACLVLMLNLLIFYLYDQVQENAINQAEREYVQRQSSYYAKLNEEIGRYWYEMQCFRHDLKQRYILEQSYLQQGNYERLAEYYRESICFLNNGKAVADTGNVCIDNIINYKALSAEKRGISIQGDFVVAFDMALNEEDICNVIGNLLDNAIEAAEGVEERDKVVNVKIKMEGMNLLVVVKNHYSGQRKKKGNTYLTTKEGGKGHGFGLKIVEQVVKKYHGEMRITDDGSLFEMKICLYSIGLPNSFL